MAIARLTGQDTANTSATASVSATYASPPTQNNLMLAALYYNVTAGVGAITGWTLLIEGAAGATANGTIGIFYKVAGAGESTTVTATATAATTMRLQIFEYSGVATSSLTDGSSSNTSGATSVATLAAPAAGQLATTNANDLLFAAWGFNASTSLWSVDSSFNILLGGNNRMTTADRIVAATGTYSPTLSWTTSQRAGGVIGAFKAATGGTLVSGADTGAGVDAATLAASLTAADTGAGADAATLTASLTATDTGTAADTAALAATLTAADTGTGVDTGTLATTSTAAETAHAADAGTVQAGVTATDTGHAVDTAFVTVQVTGTDTATATDLATLAAAVSAADLGHALDAATAASSSSRDITATAGPAPASWAAATAPRPYAGPTSRWKATR